MQFWLAAPKGKLQQTLRQKDQVWTALWKGKGAPKKQFSPYGGKNLSGRKTETHRQTVSEAILELFVCLFLPENRYTLYHPLFRHGRVHGKGGCRKGK